VAADLQLAAIEGAVTNTEAEHRTIRLAEWDRVVLPASLVLQDGKLDLFPSVTNLVSLRPHKGGIELQAGGVVGIIPLNDRLTIEIEPRVPIRNLSHMLILAGHAPRALENTVRRYAVAGDLYPSLIDLYARAMAGYVDEIALRGYLREYERREENTSFPRGRIAVGKTATSLASKGINYQVATSWFERTTDNPVNRCIKYAIWFLAQLRQEAVATGQAKREIPRMLNRAMLTMGGAELDLTRSFLSDPTVMGKRPLSPLRSYYREPLELASAIIHQRAVSFDETGDAVGLPSLIIKMSDVFEQYLRKFVSVSLAASGQPMAVLDGNSFPPYGGAKLLFDNGVDVHAKPDLVLRSTSPGGACLAVIDAKYKPAGDRPSRDDLNQILAYAMTYRSNLAVLVQPQASGASVTQGPHRLGVIGNVVVDQYVLDLDAPDLTVEEAQLTAYIVSTINSTP
jgi:5-methylcytosine-specific restriction enzyme subunit McrC